MPEAPWTPLVGLARADADGRVLYVNDALCKIVGRPREELLGDGWKRKLPPEVLRRVLEGWSQLHQGRAFHRVETWVRPDGREVSYHLEWQPELDAAGRLRSVVVTCLDALELRDSDRTDERLRDEAAARLQELEQLYDRAPVGLCAVDLQLRFLRVNRLYADRLGCTPEDLIGRSLLDVIAESSRQQAIDRARQVIESGEPLSDIEFRRPVPGDPSQERIFRLNIHPLRRDGEIAGLMAVLQNVTGIRRAEEEANARLRELDSIYRHAPVGLCFIDRDLRYLRVNRVIADLNGLSVEEVVGRTYRDLAPETADLAEPFLRSVMERGKSVRNLAVSARPPADPGVEHHFLFSMDPVRDGRGEVVGGMAALQDVTSLLRAEREAAQRLEELEILYANAPVGLCHLDRDLRIVALNPLFAQLSRRPLAEQVGALAPEVIAEPMAGRLLPQLRAVAASGASSSDLELRGRPPGGEDREHHWIARTHPLRSADGDVTGLVTVLQDVTRMAARQSELWTARERLEEAQRVSRVGSWEWDLIDDEMWWSPELYEIFGERRSVPPSYTLFFEHVHPDDREQVRQQIEQTLANDRPCHVSFRIDGPEGSERQIFAAARLERTEDGVAARLIGTCQDVTDFGPPPRTRRRRRGPR